MFADVALRELSLARLHVRLIQSSQSSTNALHGPLHQNFKNPDHNFFTITKSLQFHLDLPINCTMGLAAPKKYISRPLHTLIEILTIFKAHKTFPRPKQHKMDERHRIVRSQNHDLPRLAARRLPRSQKRRTC